MPNADIVPNAAIAKKPEHGCMCSPAPPEYPVYPEGYWCCPPPPPPHPNSNCPPPPPPMPPYPYPYPCPPVNPGVGSIEAQIGKLSKKSAIIRKMIDNLVNKNKDILISVGRGATYNFGTYLNIEGNETEYGKAVLDMLQAELEAIKNKIIELTAELEVEDNNMNGVEGTITV